MPRNIRITAFIARCNARGMDCCSEHSKLFLPSFEVTRRTRRCHRIPTVVALFVFTSLTLGASAALAEEPSEGEKLFALKLKPLLVEKCNACHADNPEDLNGGFDLRNRDAMIKGGDSFGEEVVHGNDGEASLLYRVVAHLEPGYEMPPKLADRFSEEQTWWVRDWIKLGAPWPSDQRVKEIQSEYAKGEQVATSKALREDWQSRRYDSQKLWAYRPINIENVPADVREGKTNPIDWWMDRQLDQAGITAAGDADAVTMARRIRFGLTGLPPSADEVDLFAKQYQRDPGNAVADFGEKLMSTPHYGEQFGQHWLDVTRYADSAGFANDYARPNAWRYRDYVVRAFNDDKPYDQFVREQIAGDEIDPQNPENIIATGFLRMGPWEHTSMSVFKETRQFWLDDVTDSVGQTFLAHALQCAKCHDHKFDPIPTRDYYAMMAVFSTTQFVERKTNFLSQESQNGFDSYDQWLSKKIAAYRQQEKELNEGIAKRKKAETGNARVGDNGLDPGDEASLARIRKNKIRHHIEGDRTKPFAHSVYTGKTIVQKNVQGRISIPKNPWGKGSFDPDVIFTGGSVYAHGDDVVPGALSAAESLGQMDVKPFPRGKGSRRLALAQWITDPKNPLTARVIVNRVWSWHFGKAIAGNPNNFGGTGAPPTHPQLLDYLAHWFVQNGWSVKKLNRLILRSKAYRRSSRHPSPQTLAVADPNQSLYATFIPRRLTAEELRDAMLKVSGEWNDDVGGIPARPDINSDVANQPRTVMGVAASVYEPDPLPAQRNRRSLYAEKLRGLRDPFLETFNQPGFEDSCELRETSTVAPQALTLLNTEETNDRALAFAARLLSESSNDQEVIQKAFQSALGRNATELEIETCLAAWRDAVVEEAKLEPQSKTFKTKIERTVMAERTGELYTFVEHRPTYQSYVPDLQRSDQDAKTRGLSHVCLVLFNSNEFAYLD